MVDCKTFYPQFAPNQILTSEQLNNLRDFLDCQDRKSRVLLTGQGIIHGLQETIDEPGRTISVTAGYGITSDGFLLETPAETFTHYRIYRDPLADEDGVPDYAPWQAAAEILELLTGEPAEGVEEDEEEVHALADTWPGLNDAALVLYLELAPEDQQSCLVTDCNNKGARVRLKLRVLLVPNLCAIAPVAWDPAPIKIPRFHTAAIGDINEKYRNLVTAEIPGLKDAIVASFARYGQLLELTLDAAQLDAAMAKLGNTPNQYHYDALRDLADASNEFVATACRLDREGFHIDVFPRHLVLGPYPAVAGVSLCRTRFQPAPVRDYFNHDREVAVFHGGRLLQMLASLDFAPAGEVQIAPSHSPVHALGRRTIPHYFPTGEVKSLWQPGLACAGAQPWTFQNDGAVLSNIDTDYTACSLLRIVGHLDETCPDAAGWIRDARDIHNVEFDLLCTQQYDTRPDELEIEKELRLKQEEWWALGVEWWKTVLKVKNPKPDTATQLIDNYMVSCKELLDFEEERHRKLIGTRLGRDLHCDTRHLAADYAAFRSSLLCTLHRLRGLLRSAHDALNVEELLAAAGKGDDLHTRAALWMIFDRTAGRIAGAQRKFEWAEDPLLAETLSLALEMHARKKRGTTQALYLLAGWLDLAGLLDRLTDLTKRWLPRALSAFDAVLFSAKYQAFIADLQVLRHLADLAEIPLDVSRDEGCEATAGSAAELQAVLGGLLRTCHRAVSRDIAALYEQLRANDPSLYVNLIRVDGVEHRAGVQPGGTLILVADEGGKVIADFALSGKLRCCCGGDPAAAKTPPQALLDIWYADLVAIKGKENFEPMTISHSVLGNDYIASGGISDGLRLVERTVITALGGEAAIASDGSVVYTHGNPQPETVDRFHYELQQIDEKLDVVGEDTGQVFVVTKLPAGRTGSISGPVIANYVTHGNPIPLAPVRLTAGGFEATVLADENGDFVFSGLDADTYTLQAFTTAEDGSELSSAEVQVDLTAGASEHVVLEIMMNYSKPGHAVITLVTFESETFITGATVTVWDGGEGGQIAPTETTEQGTYEFRNLTPATYNLFAYLPGLLPVGDELKIESGQTFTKTYKMGGIQLWQPPEGYLMTVVTISDTDLPHVYGVFRSRHDANVERASQPIRGSASLQKRVSQYVTKDLAEFKKKEEEVLEAGEPLAIDLARALAEAANPTDQQALGRLLLGTVLGTLDWLVLTSPTELSTQARKSLQKVAQVAGSNNGIYVAWQGEDLVKRLKLPAARKVKDLFGP